MMSDYTPAVGDRVRGRNGSDLIDVLAVDGGAFWGALSNGGGTTLHNTFDLHADWVRVDRRPDLPELPERWAVVHGPPKHPHGSVPYYNSPEHARQQNEVVRSRDKKHPPDLAYVRYVPDPDSIVWADDLDGGAS